MSYLEQLTSEGGAVADGRAAPEHPARAVWDLLERQGLTGGVELLPFPTWETTKPATNGG